MPKQIPLSQGYSAIVDDADYERVHAHRWHLFRAPGSRYPYFARRSMKLNGAKTTQVMARFILGLRPGQGVIYYKNGNPLDLRRSNLQVEHGNETRATVTRCEKLRMQREQYRELYPASGRAIERQWLLPSALLFGAVKCSEAMAREGMISRG